MTQKEVDAIVIHCSATREGQNVRAADIRRMHMTQNKWKDIGYHFVIDIDGTIEKGRPEYQQGAHCKDSGFSGRPYNTHSIGICYVGGLDINGKAKDTRTPAQKASMDKLVAELIRRYPNVVEVIGHRDASPDTNKNGKVDKFEYIKQCPCFDVRSEYEKLLHK